MQPSKSKGRQPGRSTYDPTKPFHVVDISKANYEGLQKAYPWANIKALVNYILEEHLKQLGHGKS